MGMISGLIFAEAFGIDHDLLLSILPKSITTPVAIQIAAGLGGVPSMTVVFVMIAGFSGVILGPLVLKWLRIRSSLGQGIALGSAPMHWHLQSIGIWRTRRIHEFRLNDALCGAWLILRPARCLAVSYLTKKDCPGGGQSFLIYFTLFLPGWFEGWTKRRK